MAAQHLRPIWPRIDPTILEGNHGSCRCARRVHPRSCSPVRLMNVLSTQKQSLGNFLNHKINRQRSIRPSRKWCEKLWTLYLSDIGNVVRLNFKPRQIVTKQKKRHLFCFIMKYLVIYAFVVSAVDINWNHHVIVECRQLNKKRWTLKRAVKVSFVSLYTHLNIKRSRNRKRSR